MTFEIFREPLYRRYYSSYTSASFCYALAFGAVMLLLPLLLAYNSGGFWFKEGMYYEQPKVDYRYQSVVEMYGRDSDTGLPFSLYYSTTSNLNPLHGAAVRSPVIRSAAFDDNHDGLNDRLEFSLAMPLKPTEQVSGMSAMLLADVALQDRAKVAFDTALLVHYDSGAAINNVQLSGDLQLRQTWPLQVRGGMKLPYAESPLLPLVVPAGTSESRYSAASIADHASARNLTSIFALTYALAEHVQTGGVPLTHDLHYFNATISLRVPQQQVWYTPGVSEVLKWAWVQYVSLFVVVSFLVNRLSSFVFRHQLLHTYSTADILTEKLD